MSFGQDNIEHSFGHILCSQNFMNHHKSAELIKQEKEKLSGTVIEALPDATFRVQLEDGRTILAYLAGKMRMNYIKVMIGDSVLLELSPDGKRGRIIRRI